MRNYFISETALKDSTILNENVDPKLIAPAIIEAQDIHIQTIIGSLLYDAIDTMIGNRSISGTTNSAYKLLLDDYIQPALKYYTLAELVLPMSFKLMNKSIAARSSDNANPISSDDFALVRETFMSKAEWYGARLMYYLMDHRDTYPEYLNNSSLNYFSRIVPKANTFTGGMFLEDDGINNCMPEFRKWRK